MEVRDGLAFRMGAPLFCLERRFTTGESSRSYETSGGGIEGCVVFRTLRIIGNEIILKLSYVLNCLRGTCIISCLVKGKCGKSYEDN